MTVPTAWPWITMVLAAALVLNSVGLDFLHGAFMSNEQLSRNIARPIVVMTGGILGGLCLLEFGVWQYVVRKRRSAHGVING
ncbi:hypothetical protein BH10PSE10_BH10PSE10_27660 [soil metagenome]